MKKLLFVFVILLFSFPIFALDTDKKVSLQTENLDLTYQEPAGYAAKDNVVMSLSRVIISLLVVLGLIFFVAYVYKKYLAGKMGTVNKQSMINVLGHTYLGQKKVIYVVEVAGRILVVSAAENGIHLLTEVTNKTFKKHGSTQTPFSGNLNDFSGKFK